MAVDKRTIEILLLARDRASNAVKKAENNIKRISNVTAQVTPRVKELENSYQQLDRINKTVTRTLAGQRKEFAGYALSIMFAGMAVKRFTDNIWRSGSKAFQEISHSVEGTVTGFDMLDNSMKYLQFTIGQALEPIAIALAPIIDKFTDWVINNEEVVKSIVAIGAVLGTLMTVGGGLKLAIDGFIMLKHAIIAAKVAGMELAAMSMFTKGLAVAITTKFALDAINSFQKDDFIGFLKNGIGTAGGVAILSGKKGVGGALIILSTALDIVDAVIKGKQLSKNTLANWLVQASAGAFFINPYAGGALLAIGITLKLLKAETIARALAGIAWGFGNAFSAVMDTILMPIYKIIEGIVKVYNMVTGSNIKAPRTRDVLGLPDYDTFYNTYYDFLKEKPANQVIIQKVEVKSDSVSGILEEINRQAGSVNVNSSYGYDFSGF